MARVGPVFVLASGQPDIRAFHSKAAAHEKEKGALPLSGQQGIQHNDSHSFGDTVHSALQRILSLGMDSLRNFGDTLSSCVTRRRRRQVPIHQQSCLGEGTSHVRGLPALKRDADGRGEYELLERGANGTAGSEGEVVVDGGVRAEDEVGP